MKRLLIIIVIIFALFFLTMPNPNALDLDLNDSKIEETKTQKIQEVREIPVLMYHSISKNAGGYSELVVSPESFKEQMDYLVSNSYTTITFHDVYMHIEDKTSLPPNPIILTFDDGYTDNYTNAFKVLNERDMVAVMYPYTKKINSTNGLTKNQLEELLENNWEIGSHTINHLDLTTLTVDKLVQEVRDSKQYLEELFGIDVVSFCYPAGQYNQKVVEAVKKAGYKYGVTTNYGMSNFEKNLLVLSRIRINRSDSLPGFAKKIS